MVIQNLQYTEVVAQEGARDAECIGRGDNERLTGDEQDDREENLEIWDWAEVIWEQWTCGLFAQRVVVT